MHTDIITSFAEEYRFLSNFWRVTITVKGITYCTLEHAYQAAKIDPHATNYFEIHSEIRHTHTPGRVKRLGRHIPMRKDWADIKLMVMHDLVTRKFQNVILANKLIATAPITLVEGNNWGDTYWGICEGRGENHLGHILMDVREQLIRRT